MEDRLKMVKHKAWATTSVMPKLERSMTTEGNFQGEFNCVTGRRVQPK